MAFNLFCINSGESFTFILSIINPQNLLQSLGFKISILKFFSTDLSKAKNYVRNAVSQMLSGEEVKENKTRPYGCSVKY